MGSRYSASSHASISASLAHWDVVRDVWSWDRVIRTGDERRGAKLATFVLHLMRHDSCYPSSTIVNYVWALCAFMEAELQADPRVNVIGWSYFIASVNVICFVPSEPRKRVPFEAIRSALAGVDRTDFAMVQMAVVVLLLLFTFQRSEFPFPKTLGGFDSTKHCRVRDMQPWEGGTRWAIGATKADPRAERLSSDAGAGREWIVIGEVSDELFDMRLWLALFYSFFPPGPRDPDSSFFRAHDRGRVLTYSVALGDFRRFLTGHMPEGLSPEDVGFHGVRVEGWNTCSHAVTENAAVIQGGWSSVASASRYERLGIDIARSIPRKMLAYHNPASRVVADGGASDDASDDGNLGGCSGLGIVAARGAAPVAARGGAVSGRPASAPRELARAAHQPAGLPSGWQREWRPTSGRRGGYEKFSGPDGRTARSMAEVRRIAALSSGAKSPAPRTTAPSSSAGDPARGGVRAPPASCHISVDDLTEHVTYYDRPPTRRPPRA